MSFLRCLIAVEAAAFAVAALIHSGALVRVSVDPGAAIAESVIALVLIGGALVAWSQPAWTRVVAIAVEGFGLAGSLIGLYLAVRGLGPSTVPDLVFHVAIVVTLAFGLTTALRAPSVEA